MTLVMIHGLKKTTTITVVNAKTVRNATFERKMGVILPCK